MKTQNLYKTLFIFLLVWTQTTHGDVVFSSFGPNNSFNDSTCFTPAWNVLDPTYYSTAYGYAAMFTVDSQSYALTSVSLALSYQNVPVANNLAISIVADNAGMPTGPLLETVVSHPPYMGITPQVVTYSSSLNPILAAGGTYWIVAEPIDLNVVNGNDNAVYGWYLGLSGGPVGIRDFNFTTVNWNDWQVRSETQPAFSIEGTLVPEPSAFSLWLAGAGCFVGLQCWRKFQFKAR